MSSCANRKAQIYEPPPSFMPLPEWYDRIGHTFLFIWAVASKLCHWLLLLKVMKWSNLKLENHCIKNKIIFKKIFTKCAKGRLIFARPISRSHSMSCVKAAGFLKRTLKYLFSARPITSGREIDRERVCPQN